MKIKFFYTVVLLFISFQLWGQTWSRNYDFQHFVGTDGTNNAAYSFDSNSGGLLVLPYWASTYWTGQSYARYDLLRINKWGDTILIRSNIYDTFGAASPMGLIKLTNGNYVLVADCYVDTSYFNTAVSLYFIDSSGTITSSKTIARDYWSLYHFCNVLTSENGGYYLMYNNNIFTGALNPTNNIYYDTIRNRSFLEKYDANNIKLWTNEFDYSFLFSLSDSIENENTNSYTIYDPNNFVKTIDGGILLLKEYDTASYYDTNGVQHLTGGNNQWIVEKVDSNGNIQWDVSINQYFSYLFTSYSLNYIWPRSLIATSDNGFIINVQADELSGTSAIYKTAKFNSLGILTDSITRSLDSWLGPGCPLSNGNNLFLSGLYNNSTGAFTYGLTVYDNHLNLINFVPNALQNLVSPDYMYNSFAFLIPNDIGGAFTEETIAPNTPTGYINICNFDSLFNTYPSFVSGSVLQDNNDNCLIDVADYSLVGTTVKATSDTGNHEYYGFSSWNGNYTLNVPNGNYSVTHSQRNNSTTKCPASNLYAYNVYNSAYTSQNFYDTISANLQNLHISQYIAGPLLPGADDQILVEVDNDGVANASANLMYVLDTDVQYISAVPAPVSISGDTLFFAVSNLNGDSTQVFFINLHIPNSAVLGSPCTLSAYVTLLGNPNPSATDTISDIIVGSFDPNEIHVNMPLHFLKNEELIYTVRFQNTGTYPAKNIVVENYFDNKLDLASFNLLGYSSVKPSVVWKDCNRLLFNFQNINLPDSTHNEPASRGQFSYSVRPKTTDHIGDTIKNTAYIYFDFNSAVVTNTTTNIISSAPVSVNNTIQPSSDINLYPNPSDGSFTVQLPKNASDQWLTKITDITGHSVYSDSRHAGNFNINLRNIIPGIYLVHFSNADTQEITTRKLVITK